MEWGEEVGGRGGGKRWGEEVGGKGGGRGGGKRWGEGVGGRGGGKGWGEEVGGAEGGEGKRWRGEEGEDERGEERVVQLVSGGGRRQALAAILHAIDELAKTKGGGFTRNVVVFTST